MKTTRIQNAPIFAATLLGLAAVACQADETQLRWTPHRGAAAQPDADELGSSSEPKAVEPRPLADVPALAGAPAAVVLPDEVPPVVTRQPARRPVPPPRDRAAGNRDRSSPEIGRAHV